MERLQTTPRWVEVEQARVMVTEQPEWLFSVVESSEKERLGLWLYRGKPVVVVPFAQA